MTRRVARASLVVKVPMPNHVTPRNVKLWLEGYVKAGVLPPHVELVMTEQVTVSDIEDT